MFGSECIFHGQARADENADCNEQLATGTNSTTEVFRDNFGYKKGYTGKTATGAEANQQTAQHKKFNCIGHFGNGGEKRPDQGNDQR